MRRDENQVLEESDNKIAVLHSLQTRGSFRLVNSESTRVEKSLRPQLGLVALVSCPGMAVLADELPVFETSTEPNTFAFTNDLDQFVTVVALLFLRGFHS